MRKSCFARPCAVGGIAPTRQRDELRLAAVGTLADPARELAAVHIRHEDVNEEHLWTETVLEGAERREARVRAADSSAEGLEHRRLDVRAVRIVIDHDNSVTGQKA